MGVCKMTIKKTALITGTSQGIGATLALRYLSSGYNVVGCGRINENDIISATLQQYPCYSYFPCDLTKLPDIDSLIDHTINCFGQIDVVVSNAGKNVFKGTNCSLEDWNFNFDLNLRSHWWLAKSCYQYLKEQKGVFLVMTSNHGFYSLPQCAPYSISKRALMGLVQSMTLDWGRDFRTVGIAPGYIETQGGKDWFDSHDNPDTIREKINNIHPVGHMGTCDDVADLCLFLSSPQARFIAGTTIVIDGGRSAVMQDI